MEGPAIHHADVRLTFDPAWLARRVFFSCLVLELGFVLLDYHVNYGRLTEIGAIRRLTNIAREDGLASWFGTTQTALVALTAWSIWWLVRAGSSSVWRRTGWLIISVMLTYMAVDDGAQLHERFGTLFSVLRERGTVSGADWFPSYDWQILFTPVFGAFGLWLVWFLWQELRSRTDYAIVLVAVACLGWAVGLDFVEGLEEEHPWNAVSWIVTRVDMSEFTATRFGQSPSNTLDHFSRSLEEFLEMLAMSLLWMAFLRHVPAVAGRVTVEIGPGRARNTEDHA